MDSRYDKPFFMSRLMHQPTVILESVDASTDSSSRVGWCINRLQFYSRLMHQTTLNLKSVDASTDSGRLIIPTRVGWSYRLESFDASTDSSSRVGWCINRLLFDSRLMHQPTPVLQSVDASTDSWTGVGWCINRLSVYSWLMHQPTHEKWIIIPTVHWLFTFILICVSLISNLANHVWSIA